MPKAHKQEPEQPRKPTMLVVSKDEARGKIEKQIDEGQHLLALSIGSEQELEQLSSDYSEWSDYNAELLLRLFDNDEISKEYSAFYGAAFSMNPTFADRIEYVHRDIKSSLDRLRSILRRIELFDEPESAANQETESASPIDSSRVFVVHGHDKSLKQSVARLVEHLELEPIILHEQSNEGRTIIEKFEQYADVSFAIVLLTPDDVGRSTRSAKNEESPRARQNVIFELGYFIGKLGRKRVCALYVEGVELPSDMSGVIYIKHDESDSWKYKLAREMKSAELAVDLNKIK